MLGLQNEWTATSWGGVLESERCLYCDETMFALWWHVLWKVGKLRSELENIGVCLWDGWQCLAIEARMSAKVSAIASAAVAAAFVAEAA